MLVSKINTQRQNSPKFGNNIPTKLVEEAKTALRFHNGSMVLKNGDSVTSELGHDTLVIKRPLPSPDNLCLETAVKLKKKFFGGFRVDSTYLRMTNLPHRFSNGVVITNIGQTNPEQTAKETQEILERVVQEDPLTQAIKSLNQRLKAAKKVAPGNFS